MTSPSEPRWFVLAMASRWPAAIVLAAWAVAVAAIQILKQPLPVALPQQTPFPVRLVGGVTVRNIDLPVVQVSASEPLPVSGEVSVEKTLPLRWTASSNPSMSAALSKPCPSPKTSRLK